MICVSCGTRHRWTGLCDECLARLRPRPPWSCGCTRNEHGLHGLECRHPLPPATSCHRYECAVAGGCSCLRPTPLVGSTPMTPSRKYPVWRRLVTIMIGVFLGLLIVLAAAKTADAHTPRPVACELAWQAAPVGEKWTARQVCLDAQRRHVEQHRREAAIRQVTRACLRMASRMGAGLCRAIATVRPAWATDHHYHELLRRESGADPNAVNDSSDACGAFQRLVRKPHPRGGRGCPWAFTVVGWQGRRRVEVVHATPLEQTVNGVAYIAARYGSPAAAIRFHNANGWY